MPALALISVCFEGWGARRGLPGPNGAPPPAASPTPETPAEANGGVTMDGEPGDFEGRDPCPCGLCDLMRVFYRIL